MGAIELAAIPPVHYLDTIKSQKYHLLLPELLVHNDMYKKFYIDKPVNSYRILDNGAAERQQYNIMELDLIAKTWVVDEVAMPDVLGNSIATVEASSNAIEYLSDHYGSQGINGPGYRVGIVAQGKNFEEATQCIDMLMNRHGHRIGVIYIPRLLVTPTNREIRLEIAQYIKEKYPQIDIHLFGMCQAFPGELAVIAPYGNDLIRSIDTSAPYTYAVRGLSITREYQMRPIVRPKAYFHVRMRDSEVARAAKNIGLLLNWCARYGS